MAKKTETRSEKIRRLATAEYGKGTALPAARKKIAAALGEDPSGRSLLGTVDPVYFRLEGLADPLPASAAKSRSALARAVRVRRDRGVRWEKIAASAEATLGRPVLRTELDALYTEGGGDLAASYTGRGTRVSAPKTYADPAAAAAAPTAAPTPSGRRARRRTRRASA